MEVAVHRGGADVPMGFDFDDNLTLRSHPSAATDSVAGSPSAAAGLGRFVGMRLRTVNNTPRLSDCARFRSAQTLVLSRGGGNR
eukprot:gene54967-28934_t